MTKQFKIYTDQIDHWEVIGTDYNGKRLIVSDIERFLNEQHEQIQVLKASNGEMEDYLARLEEENEQLKQQNKKLIKLIEDLGAEEMLEDI